MSMPLWIAIPILLIGLVIGTIIGVHKGYRDNEKHIQSLNETIAGYKRLVDQGE